MATALNSAATRLTYWTRWLPLVAMPAMVAGFQHVLPSWAFMWLMVLAIFGGFKWLTYCEALDDLPPPRIGRSLGYLIGSPTMDAPAFLAGPLLHPPTARNWGTALLNFSIGCALIWGLVRHALPYGELATGWVGLAGIAFALHFGVLHLWSLAWRARGVECRHIMHSPARATSVSDLWGNRWNLAFNDVVYHMIFRRLLRKIGLKGSIAVVFLVSGILHELVISWPARAGYGLPTMYFLIQALGALAERSRPGKRMKLGRGLRGWLWTLLVVAGPAFWLFHPPFVRNAVLPFLNAIGAF